MAKRAVTDAASPGLGASRASEPASKRRDVSDACSHWASNINPGEHCCALMDDETVALPQVLERFILSGIRNNARVLCVLLDDEVNDELAQLYPTTFKPRTRQALLAFLLESEHSRTFSAALDSGGLLLRTARENYLSDQQGQVFCPETVCERFRVLYTESLAAGYKALYAFGDMAWSLSRKCSGVDRIFEYESRINALGRECQGFVGFCYYDRKVFSPSSLRRVLCAHPQASVNGEFYPRNFYYIPPTELLGPDASSAKLENWLRNLRERRELDVELESRTVELHVKNVELQRQLRERAVIENQKQVAELLSQQKSLFVASVSHEIRTPLNGVTTACALLEDMRERLPGDALECVRLASMSSKYLHSLVSNVLTLGALDAGRVVIEEERFNLREAIDMTTKIILEADYAKGKRLLVHCFSANDVTVFGDQKKLTQVLMNLVRTKNLSHKPLTSAQKLSNAFKFTLDGGNVELICRLSSDDKSPCYAEITIRDDGIGIDSAKLAELTRGARLEGSGVGLGVSVTRRLLEMLGGSLYINSAGRGCGVTVSCSYPLKQVQYSSSTQPLASVLDPSLRVLLVEDNSVNAIVIRKILQRLGVTRVTTSVDGDLAVEIIRKQQHRFDVILMDIRMPGKLDGIEAARLIRSLTAPKTPKIIALTADVSADVERACAGVMDRFLTKPLNVDRFSAAMKEVCKLA